MKAGRAKQKSPLNEFRGLEYPKLAQRTDPNTNRGSCS